MNQNLTMNSDKTVEWYAVSFLDILGQKNKLSVLNNVNLTNEEVRTAIKDT